MQGRQMIWMVIEAGGQEGGSMSPQSVVHQEPRWQWSDIIPDLPRTGIGRWGERPGGVAQVQGVPSRCGSRGGGGH